MDWGKVDFKELEKFYERLHKLPIKDIDIFCRYASKQLAARLLQRVIKDTPVGKYPSETGKQGGMLRRGWFAKTHEEAEASNILPTPQMAIEYANSLAITKVGSEYRIEIINPVEYASYVEFGHRQTPGRYVPAIGKRLKASYVEPQYFLTNANQIIENQMTGILQRELDKFLKEAFNGKN